MTGLNILHLFLICLAIFFLIKIVSSILSGIFALFSGSGRAGAGDASDDDEDAAFSFGVSDEVYGTDWEEHSRMHDPEHW